MIDDRDTRTMALPGLPQPKKRGRKPIGAQAMTAAERKRRSRAAQRQAGFTSRDGRIPTPFSCELDELMLMRLRKAAQAEEVPIYTVLERLIAEHL
ncbi:hypothetical protein [Chitinimonas koreensis]|uniref:hypothetical protein n=1 Tax=Chitinimonas koreensis TaxID=356302 RepID=UPI000403EB19|nr:hypothetical protein [Chitinimonas koreensis]QNM98732.1 hypothetical protein H9L41_11225 [Chitinimonas koreensis]